MDENDDTLSMMVKAVKSPTNTTKTVRLNTTKTEVVNIKTTTTNMEVVILMAADTHMEVTTLTLLPPIMVMVTATIMVMVIQLIHMKVITTTQLIHPPSLESREHATYNVQVVKFQPMECPRLNVKLLVV